jgi:ribosomal protein S18 acetylase RimI-like enzyme
MQLTSLGYRSQLLFTDFDGASYDRGDHFALHSLTNPTFFWGNLLIFDNAPSRTDYENWNHLFKNEFTNPAIYHRTFAWQSPEVGDITKFEANGFKLESNSVLTASEVRKPAKHNPALQVRTLDSEKDWRDLLELELSTSDNHLPQVAWREFYLNQAKRYRAMEAAGMGHWYGGFLEGELVTSLGLFHKADDKRVESQTRIARFQSVATHANHLRQGFCQTLVYEVSKQALADGIETLVMCADPEYYAIKIYESVGFRRQSLEYGVSWFDPARAAQVRD